MPNSSEDSESEFQETRGRKEVLLEEYRVHVKTENNKNDKQIKIYQLEKGKAKTKKIKNEKAKLIATI